MVTLHRSSRCKINLLLNILARRPDGFHELETVMLPVPLTDELTFERAASGIELTCNHPELPVDHRNLVFRAAERFFSETAIRAGIRIHLEKRLPLAAGLGGGSSNAAVTISALNEMFDRPLSMDRMQVIAAGLGSDVPFFLQENPALGIGRGETIKPLAPFSSLQGRGLVLVQPGFGVSTAWAYQALAQHPEALHGQSGRAERLIRFLNGEGDGTLDDHLFNSLEAPVLRKFPLLQVIQDFMRQEGAIAALMSGSGSTTFAIVANESDSQRLAERLRELVGPKAWIATVVL